MVDQVDSTSTQSAIHSSAPPASSGPRAEEYTAGSLSKFLELIRFSHTIFALPFALLASTLALIIPAEHVRFSVSSTVLRLLGVVLCMVFARSAAMAFNRLVDARIDALNPRTAGRHIPAGLLSKSQVTGFMICMSLAFIASCLLFLPNWLPLILSIPVLVWICGYSYAKRFTSAAHVWLGVALALAPVSAWIGIRGEEVIANPSDLLPSVVLGLAIALWVAGFDIIYACQDAAFDRGQGLQSIPAKFGIAGALRISSFLHAAMLLVLFCLPSLFPQLSLGVIYYLSMLGVSMLVIRQHWIVSEHDLGRVNIAFFNINAIISFGLSVLTAVDAWLA